METPDALIADLGREVISLRYHIKEIPRHVINPDHSNLVYPLCQMCGAYWPCPVEKAHRAAGLS